MFSDEFADCVEIKRVPQSVGQEHSAGPRGDSFSHPVGVGVVGTQVYVDADGHELVLHQGSQSGRKAGCSGDDLIAGE